MCHTSPATYLVWSTFSSALLAFLLYHLWSFDKFKCLRWDSGPYSGAFKRVMTYSYLMSVPLLWVYSVGFAIIKYRAGFVLLPGAGGVTVLPTPYTAWDPTSRAALFPLTLLFAIAWSLEMVTHLEELCFWYFLLNAGAQQRDWFRTWQFRLWVIGSIAAVTTLPLLTIFTRSDPLQSEKYLFFTGSLGSLTITLWFLPILWMFPTFLDSLKSEGVDMGTIVRLTKFSELNRLRVGLRFLFVLPLLILGIDGFRPRHVLNENMAITDLLVTMAGLGCLLSSAMTLVIFFPRSVEGEIAERDAARSRKWSASRQDSQMETGRWSQSNDSFVAPAYAPDDGGPYKLTSAAMTKNFEEQFEGYADFHDLSSIGHDKVFESPRPQPPNFSPLRPNRRVDGGVELGNKVSSPDNSTSHSQNKARYSVNPMIHNWRSPLEFGQEPNRLSFNRP